MNLKLNFEILPIGAFKSNIRTAFSKNCWDFLRKDAYERADHKCSCCGAKPKRLEAHERWEFDIKTQTQKLVDIVALCHNCHLVTHILRTQLVGEEDKAIVHFKKVNNCDFQVYSASLKQAILKNKELDKISEWNLDLTWLNRYLDNKD